MNRSEQHARDGIEVGRDVRRRLPASPSAAAPARGDQNEIETGVFDGITVLLVEDDPISREALELIFSHYGARVVSAETMWEALRRYELTLPSLLISDIGLPQGDGYMLLRAIRAREGRLRRRVPAIAISGFPSRESGERARQAGFDAFLRKPIEIRDLLQLARALVATA